MASYNLASGVTRHHFHQSLLIKVVTFPGFKRWDRSTGETTGVPSLLSNFLNPSWLPFPRCHLSFSSLLPCCTLSCVRGRGGPLPHNSYFHVLHKNKLCYKQSKSEHSFHFCLLFFRHRFDFSGNKDRMESSDTGYLNIHWAPPMCWHWEYGSEQGPCPRDAYSPGEFTALVERSDAKGSRQGKFKGWGQWEQLSPGQWKQDGLGIHETHAFKIRNHTLLPQQAYTR